MQARWIATVAFVSAMSAFPAVSLAQFTETQKGTGVGALLGAGTGAIIGAAVHHPVAGTFIGAGVGGVGGYMVGHELEQQQSMKQLNRLWCAIEDLPGLLAIPAVWRNACGADFGLIETSLQPTSTMSAIYPCPYPNGHSCPRRILCHGDDEIACGCGAYRRGATQGAGVHSEDGFGSRLRLLGRRQGRLQQTGQGGKALVGCIQRLLRLADLIEQAAQVVRAVAEGLRSEEGGRVVERGVDLLAGRQTVLGGGQQIRGLLE